MSAEDLDLIREAILLQCRAVSRNGISAARMLRALIRSTWDVDAALLDREIRHLVSAGLIQAVESDALTPALVSYGTTAAGNHFLEKRGLL